MAKGDELNSYLYIVDWTRKYFRKCHLFLCFLLKTNYQPRKKEMARKAGIYVPLVPGKVCSRTSTT